MAFEDVEGRPPHRPWEAEDVRACLAALQQVADAGLDPDPLDLQPVHLDLPTFVDGWDRVERGR